MEGWKHHPKFSFYQATISIDTTNDDMHPPVRPLRMRALWERKNEPPWVPALVNQPFILAPLSTTHSTSGVPPVLSAVAPFAHLEKRHVRTGRWCSGHGQDREHHGHKPAAQIREAKVKSPRRRDRLAGSAPRLPPCFHSSALAAQKEKQMADGACRMQKADQPGSAGPSSRSPGSDGGRRAAARVHPEGKTSEKKARRRASERLR